MSEILKKINELMQAVRSQLSNQDSLASERSEKLDLRGAELATKDKEVGEREVKVKEVENVITVRNQALADKKLAEDMLKTSRQEKADTDAKVKASLTSLDQAKKLISQDFEKCKNELAMIQKEWLGLKKEQETWKEKFMESLKKKLK